VEISRSSTQPMNQTTAPNENDESVNPNNGTRVEKVVVGAGKDIGGIHMTLSEETFRINEEKYN
jgi:hypothetical protein